MILYTPWSNLLKTNNMAIGEVSFRDQNMVLSYFSLAIFKCEVMKCNDLTFYILGKKNAS